MNPGTLKRTAIACFMALYASSSFAIDYGDPGWSSLPTKTQQQILQIDQMNAQFGYTSPGYKKYLIMQKQNAAPSTTAAHTPASTPATTPASTPASTPAPSTAPTTPATSSPCANLGINLNEPSYYSAVEPFVDLMKSSSGWTHPGGSPYAKLPIQEDQYGNPLSLGNDRMLTNYVTFFMWRTGVPASQIPTEQYVLTWDGNGLVTPNQPIISNDFHRIVFQVHGLPGTKLWVNLTSTDAADPVHNVRIVPLAMEHSTQVFRQPYLDSLRNFSAFRFMDWNSTNFSSVQHWSQRTTPQSVTQQSNYNGTGGVAYEYMIQLANQMHADMWVNIPALADNDYITQMAHLFNSMLAPGRTVYVEYSNEAWNWGFSAWHQLQTIGVAEGYNRTQPNTTIMGMDVYSDKVAQAAEIWHSVFNANPTGPRVKMIMAAREADWQTLNEELSWHNNYSKVDAAAVAYYIGGNSDLINANNASSFYGYSPDQLAQAIISKALPTHTSLLKTQLAIVGKYHLPLYFYEGGQGLAPAGREPDGTLMANDKTIVTLENNAQQSPVMTNVYKDILSSWHASGVGLFMLYNDTEPGWGARMYEHTPLNQAPKLQGVYDFCGWK